MGVEKASAEAQTHTNNIVERSKPRLALKRDADGNIFVEVNPHIAGSVESPKQIAETLAQIVRTKFTSLIDIHGQKIGINQRTAREWLRSKSADKLFHTDSRAFLDKINAFENADELLIASKDYIGEAAKHERKDNFVEFARGIVSFKVGENGYEADIIVGTTKSNAAILYDVVNIQHKKIVAGTTDTAQDRRSGVSATTNSIRENSENVNSRAAKSEAVQANTAYALQEALETLGDYDAIRKRHIESNENDRISRNYDEIVNFIKSLTRETPVRRLHIGTISERTAALVHKKTGVNIKGYDFVLASNFISHIFDSHGNIATEAPRGQRTVNYSNIENILETVISPDDVLLANEQNGTALRFEKELDGKNIAITITSTKKSTLTLKSAWIINKKSGGRTPSANASTFAGTSETNGRSSTSKQSTSPTPNVQALSLTSETGRRIKTVSNNSIAENSEKVNPREVKTVKSDSNKRYALIGKNEQGIEVYKTSEAVKKLTFIERKKEFLRIMSQEYKGRTAKFNKNGAVYYAKFDSVDVRKNIYGDKKSDKKGYNAKINTGADGNAFELVENSQYRGSSVEQEGKKNSAHKGVKSWDYFIKQVQIDGRFYDLVANVRKIAGDEYVYSIQLNESKKTVASPLISSQQGEHQNRAHNATDNNSIFKNSEKVNQNSKKRYALSIGNETINVEAEKTKNLVALHNLSETSLLKVLQLGGFPMPSIAITRADMGHTQFGDITVVFGRDTIDPQSDSRNKVYARDAWTPTAPKVEYKPNEKVQSKIHRKYYELSKKFGYEVTRPLYNYVNDIERQFDLYGGEIGLISELYNNAEVINLFLADTNGKIVEPIYKDVRAELSKAEIEFENEFISNIGKELIEEFEKVQDIDERITFIVNALADIMVGKNQSIEEIRASIEENFSTFKLGMQLNEASRYLETGGVSVRREYDPTATEKAILKATPKQEYIAWVDKLFGGIEEKTGIYNGKDPYTPSGNNL